MPLPRPRPGEDQNSFISRCIPAVMREGKDQEQAAAICFDLWRGRVASAEQEQRLKAAEGLRKACEEIGLDLTVTSGAGREVDESQHRDL